MYSCALAQTINSFLRTLLLKKTYTVASSLEVTFKKTLFFEVGIMNQNNIFDKVEKKTGVKMDEILKIADSVKHANFKDEATVRNLIRRIGKVANRSVNKQTEDQIVDAIVNGSQPLNFDTIAKMLNNKR